MRRLLEAEAGSPVKPRGNPASPALDDDVEWLDDDMYAALGGKKNKR